MISSELYNNSGVPNVVADRGGNGFGLEFIANPFGTFVSANSNLYVTYYGNDRIQRLRPGQSNGTTVARNRSLIATISLNYPGEIVLDSDGFLFIVNGSQHHIIDSEFQGFRSLFGCCMNKSSSVSALLNTPYNLHFDS